MNRKHWLILLGTWLLLAALAAIFLRPRSPTPTPPHTASPIPTHTLSSTALPTTDWDALPTVTPPGPGEPTLPPEALAMRAAPTATPSPSPPTPTLTPTPTTTPTPISTPRPVPATGHDAVPMVEVPAGEFVMGLTFEEARWIEQEWDKLPRVMLILGSAAAEVPQLIVYLDTFSIDKFEVTNARYRRCVEVGVCQPISGGWSGLPKDY